MTNQIQPQSEQKELSLRDDILETIKINLSDAFLRQLEQEPESIVDDYFPALFTLDSSLIYDAIPTDKGKMMSLLVEIEQEYKDIFEGDVFDEDRKPYDVLCDYFQHMAEDWYDNEVYAYFKDLVDEYQDSLLDHAADIVSRCNNFINTRDHI